MVTLALAEDRVAHVDAYQLSGDANGLAYDATTETLYAADARIGAVWAMDDTRKLRIATIPSAGIVTTQRLAGLALTPFGSLFVARLGHGRAGGVFRVESDGRHEQLAGIDPRFWRVGLHYDVRDHVLYSTQFLKSRSGPFDGSVVEIDLTDGYVSTTVTGFGKPVGVTRVGDALIVTDAARSVVVRVDLSHGRATTKAVLTDQLGRPDSICALDERSVLVTAFDREARRGSLHIVALDGKTRAVASGNWEPRGVSTDGTRAFVAMRRTGCVRVFPL